MAAFILYTASKGELSLLINMFSAVLHQTESPDHAISWCTLKQCCMQLTLRAFGIAKRTQHFMRALIATWQTDLDDEDMISMRQLSPAAFPRFAGLGSTKPAQYMIHEGHNLALSMHHKANAVCLLSLGDLMRINLSLHGLHIPAKLGQVKRGRFLRDAALILWYHLQLPGGQW